MEVLEQIRSCWIEINNSMSRTFQSEDRSQLVQR